MGMRETKNVGSSYCVGKCVHDIILQAVTMTLAESQTRADVFGGKVTQEYLEAANYSPKGGNHSLAYSCCL